MLKGKKFSKLKHTKQHLKVNAIKIIRVLLFQHFLRVTNLIEEIFPVKTKILPNVQA